MSQRHSHYLEEIFEPQKVIDNFLAVIPSSHLKKKSMVYVGTGLSGTAALFILKQAGVIDRIAITRKDVNTHSIYKVECSHDFDPYTCNWIFVDDCIDTGETFKQVLERFNRDGFRGCVLYHAHYRWRTPERLIKRYSEEI